ncbi:MAG: ABC transporter substrate-binding protein [Chloroflexi bacterium]|nr:ABC transporter substrate-binding protein [Chloroflexota bacterium]
MKKYFLLSLALVTMLMMIAACAPTPTPAPTLAPPTAAPKPTDMPKPTDAPKATEAPKPTTAPATAAPKPTDVPKPAAPTVLRFRLTRDPRTLEPGLFLELITGYIAKDLHAGLVRYNEKMELVPFIAKEWSVSTDGLTYTFKLRDDVKFHNGRKVVADDFVYTFTRILNPKVKAAAGPANLAKVKGVKDFIDGKVTSVEGLQAPDATTFKIVMAQPDPALMLRLGTNFMAVVPKEAVIDGEAKWKDKPVGAGAYKYVDWQPNVKVVLEANPDFFLGKPKVDRIEYLTVPDAATALAQYQKGELDILGVTGAQLAQIERDATLSKELNQWSRGQLTFFALNEKRVPAFKDKNVRQAFNYAVNRKDLIEKVLRNDRNMATGYVPVGIPEAIPNETGYAFDPAKAKELMAKAGFADGKGFPKIEFVTTADEQTLAEAITAQLKANLGVDVAVRIGESGDVLNGLWAKDKWDIVSWGWSADRPASEVWLFELLYSKAESNFASYSNPEYDKLVDMALAETDPAKRLAAWREVAKMASDEAPLIPFGFAKHLFLVKPYVKGFSADLLGPRRFETVEIVK